MGVSPVAETLHVLSISAGPRVGHRWWVESQLLAGVACSMRSQVYSIMSEVGGRGVGGFIFPIYLGVPLTPAPLLMLLLRALCSKQLIQ